MKIGNLYNDKNGDDDGDDSDFSVVYNFKRYIFFLQKEYIGENVPIEELSFLRAVDFYIMEENPVVNDSNIKRFHHRLFKKCNESIEKFHDIKMLKIMLSPIKKALQ